MTGYQEILTDPSYRGQIVCMTYPEIGNYGVNLEDVESPRPQLAGFIVREWSRRESNFRSSGRLDEYLAQNGIPGIAEIDTRALVRRLRSAGAMKGVLSSIDLDDASLVAKAKASPGLVGRDLVREVIPEQPRSWNEKLHELAKLHSVKKGVNGNGHAAVIGSGENGHPHLATASRLRRPSPLPEGEGVDLHVVALDYGMKWNILRHLAEMGCRVTVLPGTASVRRSFGSQAGGRVFVERAWRPRAVGVCDQDHSRRVG